MQDAVELLKGVAAACGVTKTKNDPSMAGAITMTVGALKDGYRNCDRMCMQILALFAYHELTSDAHRQMVMVFDNSTGHAAYEAGALLANHIQLKPGGEQAALDDFKDDNGKLVHTKLKVGDTFRWATHIHAPKTAEQHKAELEAAERDPRAKKSKHGEDLGHFKAGDIVKEDGRTAALIGLPKGGKQLLMEMGLWEVNGKVLRVLHCNVCKKEKAATREMHSTVEGRGCSRP